MSLYYFSFSYCMYLRETIEGFRGTECIRIRNASEYNIRSDRLRFGVVLREMLVVPCSLLNKENRTTNISRHHTGLHETLRTFQHYHFDGFKRGPYWVSIMPRDDSHSEDSKCKFFSSLGAEPKLLLLSKYKRSSLYCKCRPTLLKLVTPLIPSFKASILTIYINSQHKYVCAA